MLAETEIVPLTDEELQSLALRLSDEEAVQRLVEEVRRLRPLVPLAQTVVDKVNGFGDYDDGLLRNLSYALYGSGFSRAYRERGGLPANG
jgi:thiamine monophosphate kinase